MRPSVETDDMRRAAGFAGFVAVADTLVACDEKYKGVLSSLLGRTLVFDHIDHATAMAKALKYRVRVVTLDGQQINVGGSFTGGSAGRKNGSLSRAAEIKRMEEDLKGLETAVTEAETKLTSLREQIKRTDDDKNTLEDKRDLTRAIMAGETDKLSRARANLDANEALLNRVREDSEAILRQNEENETTMASLRAEEKGLETSVSEIKLDGVVITHKDGTTETVSADSVILSVGYNPAPVATKGVHVIGDAKNVGNLRTVIWGAWDVCMKL